MLQLSEQRLLSVSEAIGQDIEHNSGIYSDFMNNPNPYVMGLTRTLSTYDGLRFGVEFFIKKPVVEPTEALYLTTVFPHELDITCYQITDGSGIDIWVNPFELSNNQKSDIFTLFAVLLRTRSHCAILLSQELDNANIYEITYFISFLRVTLLFRRPYRFDKNRPSATADALVAITEDIKVAFCHIVTTSSALSTPIKDKLIEYAEDSVYRTVVDSCEPPPTKNVTEATMRKRIKADIPTDLPTVLMVRHNRLDIEAATNPKKPTKLRRNVDV